MRLDLLLPAQPPGFGLDRIDPTGLVAEEQRMLPPRGNHQDGGAHGPVRFEIPVDAAGGGVERVDPASGTAHEQDLAEHGGLREGGDVAVEAEGPFQLEPPRLIDAEFGRGGRLVASVISRRAPPVPFGLRRTGQVYRAVGTEGLGHGWAVAAGDAEVRRYSLALVAAERIRHAHHDAEI